MQHHFDSDWFWLILIDSNWLWLILIDFNLFWFWFIRVDSGWFWLIQIYSSLLSLFKPAFFGSLVTRGGADLPPPSKNGCNGWEVQKLSWNLISYQDWCQTWGFTTFRYLEPPQLMVWKSYFFRGSMRFVRVPPYESGVKLTNFTFSWQNSEFLWDQKCSPHFLNQNEELSKKIGACICIYTRVYANTWQGGLIQPPPTLNRVNYGISRITRFLCYFLSLNLASVLSYYAFPSMALLL